MKPERWDAPARRIEIMPPVSKEATLALFVQEMEYEKVEKAYPTWFKVKRPQEHFWDVHVDGALAGWAALRFRYDNLYELAVGLRPAYWNQGVRPRVKALLAQEARRMGAGGLVTQVALSNPTQAVRLLRESQEPDNPYKFVGVMTAPPPGYLQFCWVFDRTEDAHVAHASMHEGWGIA